MGRIVHLLKFFNDMCGFFLSLFFVLCSMLCYVSKWVRVVYLRSVSCAQWCVMLVSGVRVFIFVLCPVLNGVIC